MRINLLDSKSPPTREWVDWQRWWIWDLPIPGIPALMELEDGGWLAVVLLLVEGE